MVRSGSQHTYFKILLRLYFNSFLGCVLHLLSLFSVFHGIYIPREFAHSVTICIFIYNWNSLLDSLLPLLMQPAWERAKTCLCNFHSIFSGSKGASRKYFWAGYPSGWSTRNEHFPFFLGVTSYPGHSPVNRRCYTHYSLLGSYTLCHCQGCCAGDEHGLIWLGCTQCGIPTNNSVDCCLALFCSYSPPLGMKHLIVLLPFCVSVLPLKIHVDLSLWFASLVWFSLL